MNLSLCNNGGVTFQLLPRYSLKFTCCSLLLVRSVAARCKLRSLLVAEVARCKQSLVTHCEIRLILIATNHFLLNAKNHSSLVKTITSP